MQDDALVFLPCAGEEARYVDERYQRNVEAVAEAHEAGCLARSVAVEHAGEHLRLVGNDADRLAVHACETHDDVLGIVALHFEELAVVYDGVDDVIHIVRAAGIVRHDVVELVFEAVDGVGAVDQRSFLHVVLRHVADELADELEGLFAIFGSEVCHAALGGMDRRAAELFLRNVLAGNGFHYRRACEEHVADAFGHDGEVGERGAIYGTACAGPEDG